MRHRGVMLAQDLNVTGFAMHAMHRDHIRPKETDVAEELRIVHAIARTRGFQFEISFGDVRGDQHVLLIGQLPGLTVALFIDRPDHVGGKPYLHPATWLVVAAYLHFGIC